MNNIFKIWKYIDKKERRNFIYLLILTLIASVAEILNISIIIPFVNLLSDESNKSYWFYKLNKFINIEDSNSLVVYVGLIVSILVLISASLRYIQMKKQILLSTEIAASLSNKLFKVTLEKELIWHNNRSSSQNLAGAEKARMLVSYLLYPAFFIITNLIVGLSILAAIIVNVEFYIVAPIGAMGILYYVISRKIKNKARIQSEIYAACHTDLTKCMQDAYGSIRDLRIYNLERFYEKKYFKIISEMQNALKNILQFSASPRYLIEAIGMLTFIFVIVVTNILIENKSIELTKSEAAATVIMMAVGLQRLLPIMQGVFSSYTGIQGSMESVNEVLEILDSSEMKNEASKNEKIKGDIILSNIAIKFEDRKILDKVNIKIPQGKIVGVKGLSGSGKTTLIDIIMAIIDPTDGNLHVGNHKINQNNKAIWQENISYLSQQVFLIDGTIKDNIIIGNSDEFDEYRYNESLIRTDLTSFEKNRQEVTVGERGAKISGGQKQRIGLARAYYKKSDYIILDEPTSSLDKDSEDLIYKLLSEKSEHETIIIISHSENLLNKVDIIYEVKDNAVVQIKH